MGSDKKIEPPSPKFNRLEEEIRRYDKLILNKPDDVEAYFNRGLLFFQLRQLEEAIKNYNKAIQIKPNYAEAFNNRGIAFQELGQLETAIENYNKAIQIKPDYPGAYHNQGIALRELGQLENSIESCDNAIQINPDYAEAYHNRGITFQELGQQENAIESYNKAIQINPDYAEVYVDLAIALQELGQLEKAIVSCNKAVQLKPSSFNAQHILNSLLGNDAQSTPKEYITSLFNKYAQNYEKDLVNNLSYTAPSFFKKTLSSLNLTNNKFNKAIDLGCGTGLVGAEFRNIVDVLIGIDLSEKMIRQAKEKNVYDELIVNDLINGLQALKISFDLFVSADVFIYLGDLSSLFRNVKKHANNESLFMFSTEDIPGDGFFLQKTGRFAHSKNYILSTASSYGFQLEHFEKHNLRKHKNEWIVGGIYILKNIIN